MPSPGRSLARGATRAVLLAALALPAAPAAAQPAAATAPTAPPGTAAIVPLTLDNGLQVVVVENHSVPLATASLVVRTGAMTQRPEDQGVPHLFEHMLFKGYRGAGGRPFGLEAAELRASYNGTTGEELVTYHLTLPSTDTERALRLLARLVREARFTESDLNTERFVVLGELQRGESEPQQVLHRVIGQELWGDGWVRKNTIGEATTLLAVDVRRLREIYDRWYVPNNAALVVTGDVDAARIHEAARRHFGGWEQGADPFAAHPVAPMPPLAAHRAVVLPGDVGAITIQLQWQGPGARDAVADTYAADVLSEVVNDAQSGFTRRLVDDGFFTSARMSYQTLAHTGPVTFVGTTTVEQLGAALTMLAAELQMMTAPDYFEPRALAVAAKRRRVAQSFEREEGVTLAHTLGYWWAVTGLPYHAAYADGLAARTPADLTAFVARYLASRPFAAGVLTPPGQERQVAAMMDQFIDMARGNQ